MLYIHNATLRQPQRMERPWRKKKTRNTLNVDELLHITYTTIEKKKLKQLIGVKMPHQSFPRTVIVTLLLKRSILRAVVSPQLSDFVVYFISTADPFVWIQAQAVTAFRSFSTATLCTVMFPKITCGRITIKSLLSVKHKEYNILMNTEYMVTTLEWFL